jgi:streptogramin lyase
MRGTRSLTGYAAVAALFALVIAGCKYSNTSPPLPGPSPAPTLQPGVVTEAPIPTANATPLGITTGPDNNIWFVELNGDRIARVVPGTFPAASSITEFPLPSPNSQPADVTSLAGNPNVWFDEFQNNKIASIVPSTGVISEFTVPTAAAGPIGLVGDQTSQLWFAESQIGVPIVAKMTTGGFFTEYPVPITNARPTGVTIAPDNSVWYLDTGTNAIGHLTFSGGNPVFSEFAIPTNPANPEFMVVGPDGNLWFTELGPLPVSGCQIGKVTLGATPTITEYQLPLQQPAPHGDFCIGITSAGGFLWFAEANSGAVGRVTTGGVVTEYGIPGTGTTAVGVTRGPDGNVWFTDGGLDNAIVIGTNQVGQIKIGLIPASSNRKFFQAKIVSHALRLPIHGVYPRHR